MLYAVISKLTSSPNAPTVPPIVKSLNVKLVYSISLPELLDDAAIPYVPSSPNTSTSFVIADVNSSCL